jgi:hypothetical protein
MEPLVALAAGLIASIIGRFLTTEIAQRVLHPRNLRVTKVEASLGGVGVTLGPRQPPSDDDITQRLDHAVRALTDAQAAAADLATDIKRRRQEVERLETEQQLLQLTAQELEAVRATIRGELAKEGRRSFWLGVLVNFVFFCLGVGATLLVG